MKIDLPVGVTTIEAAEAVRQSIADALGIHPQNVNVSVSPDGTVSYTISNE